MLHRFSIAVLAVLVASQASEAQFSVGANFQTMVGGSGGGSEAGVTPPDTQGGAGQNHIMILNNGRYKTFSKTGVQLQSKTEDTFFADALYTGASPSGDPRVQFDPLSGRWFAVNFTGGTNNRLIIAVSQNADPTGLWKSTFIQTSGGTFADFPTMAVDKNGIYIGTNNFTSTFQNVHLFTVGKSDLLWTGAGSPSLASLTSHQSLSAGDRGFTPQGTNNYDVNQSGTNNRVVAGFNSTNLRTYNIQNTGGTTTLGTGAFAVVNSMPSPPSATQPNGVLVQTNDNRIGSATMQVGDRIFAVNSFDNGTGRSQIRFTVISASSGAVLEQGNISSATLALYFPSIAVNQEGHAVIGFSGSSSGQFISSYAAVSTTAGTLSFGSPTLVSAGLGNYVGFDGAPHRWGDYSATAVDPADTGIFWTFQERATATASQYATQATEIIPTVANEVRWQTAANGNFATSGSWFGGVAPGAADHAIYSRNGSPFTVTLPVGSTSNDRISVRQGTTTFDIAAGSTYDATQSGGATPSFAVSQFLGQSTVNIQGGGRFNTVHTTLAAGENGLTTNNISSATVNVSNATWNNTGDLHLGGSFTRSGGTASLNVSNNADVNVGGVARFWTSASNANLNSTALASATWNVGGLRADSGVNSNINATGANSFLNITNGLGQNYFGTISGSIVVGKSGIGVQTLSGAMSYTGPTNITGGRLNINGVKSGTGAVNVSNGGTLGGTGSVAGTVNMASGAVLAPGNSAGNLTLTTGLSMTAGTYEWELAALTEAGPGANFDVLTLTGGASVLGGTSQVLLSFIGAGVNPTAGDPFWNNSRQWRIVDLVGGTLAGNFGGIVNPGFAVGNFTLTGGSGSSIFLNFSPIPEPSSFALATLGLVAFLVVRRRAKPASRIAA